MLGAIERMDYTIYMPSMKPVGQTQGCILPQSSMFRSFGADSQVWMRAIIPLLVEGELDVFQPKYHR